MNDIILLISNDNLADFPVCYQQFIVDLYSDIAVGSIENGLDFLYYGGFRQRNDVVRILACNSRKKQYQILVSSTKKQICFQERQNICKFHCVYASNHEECEHKLEKMIRGLRV